MRHCENRKYPHERGNKSLASGSFGAIDAIPKQRGRATLIRLGDYKLPGDLKPDDFSSAVIRCRRFSVAFSTAELRHEGSRP
jgi:hypothetical protein